MKKLSTPALIACILCIVGALNWGLVGFLDFNLVAYLFKGHQTLERIVYALVGVSGVYTAYSLFFGCSAWCERS
jgi:uncharacterized protein